MSTLKDYTTGRGVCQVGGEVRKRRSEGYGFGETTLRGDGRISRRRCAAAGKGSPSLAAAGPPDQGGCRATSAGVVQSARVEAAQPATEALRTTRRCRSASPQPRSEDATLQPRVEALMRHNPKRFDEEATRRRFTWNTAAAWRREQGAKMRRSAAAAKGETAAKRKARQGSVASCSYCPHGTPMLHLYR